MDYKEKYKNALANARQEYNTTENVERKQWLEELFPELNESEDDRMRKELIEHIKANKCADYVLFKKFSPDNVIAWLEKQGNKPQGKSALEAIKEEKVDNTNKIEVKPKFKVGDWIIRSAEGFKHNTYLVTEVKDYYVCEELKGRRLTFTFNDVNKNFKLWDISDAKDGDVLFIEVDGSICIFKKLEVNSLYSYIISDGKLLVEDSHYYYETSDNIHPATKEQRELLFSKMREAGYVFDFENKQLRKIEQKSDSFCKKNCRGFKETGKCYADGSCDAKIKAEQNSSWSEEDERNLQNIDSVLFREISLREDECMRLRDWLQSLKERAVWKPSEEQLYWLKYAANSTSDTEKGN